MLRNENMTLKEKLSQLQSERSRWSVSVSRMSNGKKATTLLAMLFMVSLNFSNLGGIYRSVDTIIVN